MTLQEITFSILRTARGGGDISNDEKWQERHIYNLVNKYRNAFIVTYQMQANPLYPQTFSQAVQDLGCMPLSNVDAAECAGIAWGKMIKRIVDMPTVLDIGIDGLGGYEYVGRLGKGEPAFTYTPVRNINKYNKLRFGGTVTRWSAIGTTLYVFPCDRDISLGYTNVRIVANDPTQVSTINAAGVKVPFDIMNDNYPCPDFLIPQIEQAILKEYMGMMLQTQTDDNNKSASI